MGLCPPIGWMVIGVGIYQIIRLLLSLRHIGEWYVGLEERWE